MIRKHIAGLFFILITGVVAADSRILSMEERAAVIDRWLTTRVETILPGLMRRAGIDMWVLVSRE